VAHIKEDDTKQSDNKSADKVIKSTMSLGGLLGGLGGFIEKLGELAAAGESLSQSGEFKDATGKIRGIYGINVKTAMGESGQTEIKIEPFGNVRQNTPGRTNDDDVREPLMDIYEEEDHVLILVELPGVVKENISLEVKDGQVQLSAKRGNTTYGKEFALPDGCLAEKMSWECSNGILQVRFER
jgi:HSP20 family protein